MSVHGRAVPLRVYWHGRASRAAAALLLAALRHVARYSNAELASEPLCDLVASLPPLTDALDQTIQQVALVPASAWGAAEAACAARSPRLRALGAGAAPPRLRLHALLPPGAAGDARCRRGVSWLFYSNESDLVYCGFLNETDASTGAIQFFYPNEWKDTALELVSCAAGEGVRLRARALPAGGRARVRAPALLLDYDVWAGAAGVLPVHAPPRAPPLDAPTMRLADDSVLRTVAPAVLRLFNIFRPESRDLREVLESEAGVEEAACVWVQNSSDLPMWNEYAANWTNDVYEVAMFLCEDDPHLHEYVEMAEEIVNITVSPMRPPFRLNVQSFGVSCRDEHSLMRLLTQRVQSAYWARLAGALGAGAGVRAAAGAAQALDTALAVYDVPAAPLPPAARAASAAPAHRALALRHLLASCGWSRLLLLCDDTESAADLVRRLREARTLKLKVVPVAPIGSALKLIEKERARIIFVNTDGAVAASVLCAAREAGLVADAGYVWIVREWHAATNGSACPGGRLEHLTVSLWRRGGGGGGEAARALERRWAGRAWPLHAAPLADALMMLLHSFQRFLHKHPQRRTDLHGGNATKLLWENVEESTIEGVAQPLKFTKLGLSNPLIFVDRWNGSLREPIAEWQICADTVEELREYNRIFDGEIPSDGTIACATPLAGDSFSGACRDGALWGALGAALLALPALLAVRRARRARLERRDRARAAALLARGQRAAAALAAHLVDRARLRLRHQLGRRVRLAELRKPGRASAVVAVKALREEASVAEEREFLKEACVLATLRHGNVVRLVGVCAVGGPPLLLMEHAFFGDLQRYLSRRRHLARAGGAEARHVAAAALTRLGRDAAAALEYLAARRVVHCDVRASNCLVDARRSLKLGDFGMARRAGVGADGEAEYACRRRGLFPVLWMAPESLARGVFTAASDAWALGVLLLEVVSLGARPYAAWPPQRVARYVSAGGSPPLPSDIDPHTRRVLARCWRRAAAERPAAAELRALLDARPELLRPALAATDPPTDP